MQSLGIPQLPCCHSGDGTDSEMDLKGRAVVIIIIKKNRTNEILLKCESLIYTTARCSVQENKKIAF